MRLTVGTDYGLRVLMYVAMQGERRSTISEIAEAYGISEAHVKKVALGLGRHGWVRTLRGRGGGLILAREPGLIRLGEVVRKLEPDFALAECLGSGSQCRLTGICKLTEVLQDALGLFQTRLDNSTLADILPNPPGRQGPPPHSIPIVPAGRGGRPARTDGRAADGRRRAGI